MKLITMTPEVKAKAEKIKLLIMDVDGVLTDGRIYMNDKGEEMKSFHVLDGHGLKMLQSTGVQVAVITGRDSPSVGNRIQQLGIHYYYKGVRDKGNAYVDLRSKLKFQEEQCAFIGDDVVDLPIMLHCGLAVSVRQAHDLVLSHAMYITKKMGGEGAVRELCELIMQAQGTLESVLNEYTQ